MRKMNRNKWHEVGNLLYGIGFGFLIWLLWDVDHIGNASDFGAAVEFAIFKFVAAIICMGVGAIIQQESSRKSLTTHGYCNEIAGLIVEKY